MNNAKQQNNDTQQNNHKTIKFKIENKYKIICSSIYTESCQN